MAVGLFCQVASDRTRGNGFKSSQGRFRLDIKKHFFPEMVIKHWNSLLREVVETPSLEAFKSLVNVAFRGVVWWWNWQNWINDWMMLKVFSNLSNSMII